jgi:hypothetical protein
MGKYEDAIKDLTAFVEADIGDGDLHISSVYAAIEALREAEKRDAGCEYCNEPEPAKDCILPDGTEQFLCSRDGLFGDCYINTRKISYCPMCGKPLAKEASK